jgi:hypothetical protein
MKTYNFNTKCPSLDDMYKYIDKRGSNEFVAAFEQHLSNCELCKDAVEGLQNTNINVVNQKISATQKQLFNSQHSFKKYRFWAYAASIIILMGLSLNYLYTGNTTSYIQYQDINYTAFSQKTSVSNKKLLEKSNDIFIYINSCNRIAYNDRFLSQKKLEQLIKSKKDISLIRVEVSSNNYACANKIIDNIKNSITDIPVITIKK